MSGTSERSTAREYLVLAWVVGSSIAAYAALAYAILQSHGDVLRAIVNRLFGSAV